MSNDDIRSNRHLLGVASRNLKRAKDSLGTVAWPAELTGIGDAISAVSLALQQTINVVDNVLEDL